MPLVAIEELAALGEEERIAHTGTRGRPAIDLRLLVQSAQYILGPFGSDGDLRRFGLALVARDNKSAKKRAPIAVARQLAVLLHRLWLSPIEYDPLRHAEGSNPSRRRRA